MAQCRRGARGVLTRMRLYLAAAATLAVFLAGGVMWASWASACDPECNRGLMIGYRFLQASLGLSVALFVAAVGRSMFRRWRKR